MSKLIDSYGIYLSGDCRLPFSLSSDGEESWDSETDGAALNKTCSFCVRYCCGVCLAILAQWSNSRCNRGKLACKWEDKWAATCQNQQSECAPSKDSDQPGHLPSLIRVFTVRMKKPWVLSFSLSAQRRLWSDWAMPRLIWVFPGCTVTLLVLSCHGSSS